MRDHQAVLGGILSLAMALPGPLLHGQVTEAWVARYVGPGGAWDRTNDIAVGPDGNILVTGSSYGGGTSHDYATLKYDAEGTLIWEARYDGPGSGDDFAQALAVDGAGNVYVTGSSWGRGSYSDYATIKYDAGGNQVWGVRYNGPANLEDEARAIAVDSAGTVFVTGNSRGIGTFDDCATVAYAPNGAQVWVARYNGPGNGGDGARAIALDRSGTVLIAGHSWGSGTDNDFVTIAYDSSGAPIWVARYNGPANTGDEARALAVDATGGVYVTGDSGSEFATIKYIPSLEVHLASDAEVVARGDTLGFQVHVTNNTDEVQRIRLWTHVVLPDGSAFPPDGALVGPVSVTVPPDTTLSGHLTHPVPQRAPFATFTYVASVGPSFPVAWDTDAFLFTVVPDTASGSGGGEETPPGLLQVFPNPFRSRATIRFQVARPGGGDGERTEELPTVVRIYNLRGGLVRTLRDLTGSAGSRTLSWDGRDERGKAVASGIYVARLERGGTTAMGKVILAR